MNPPPHGAELLAGNGNLAATGNGEDANGSGGAAGGITDAGNLSGADDLLVPRVCHTFQANISCSAGDEAGRLVAIGLITGVVVVWDIYKSLVMLTCKPTSCPVYALSFYNYRILLFGDQKGTFGVIDILSGELKAFEVDEDAEPKRDIAAIKSFPGSRVALSLSSNGSCRLHEINAGKIVCNLILPDHWHVVRLVKPTLNAEVNEQSNNINQAQGRHQSLISFLSAVSATKLSIKSGMYDQSFSTTSPLLSPALEEDDETQTKTHSRPHSLRRTSASQPSQAPSAKAREKNVKSSIQNQPLNKGELFSAPDVLNVFGVHMFDIPTIVRDISQPRNRRASTRASGFSPIVYSPELTSTQDELANAQTTDVLKTEVLAELSDDMVKSTDLTYLFSGTEKLVVKHLLAR